MNASVLILSLVLFSFGMGIHILIWRVRKPAQDAIALLFCFLMPAICLFFIPWEIFDKLGVLLLLAALACAYIQIYPASQADSPSLKILVAVNRSGEKGMTLKEVESIFRQGQLFEERLSDLVNAFLVEKKDGVLKLTSKGRALILPFIMIRKVMGMAPGEG